MRWDEVERELYVVGNDLSRLSRTFMALAQALRREREYGSVSAVRGGDAAEVNENGAAEPTLPF